MERKIHNFQSFVLSDLTLEKEGYHPDKLGTTSTKFIWATCRFCGHPSRLRKGQFNNKGSACHNECKLKEQSLSGSPFKDKSVQEKSKKTNLERYGSEHANKNKEIAKRISDTKKLKNPSALPVSPFIEVYDSLPSEEWTDWDSCSLLKTKVHNQILEELKPFIGGLEVLISDKSIIADELGLYFPSLRLAIDFNVCFGHSEAALGIKEAQHKHIDKTKKCRENSIRLFHIFEHQWNDRKKQICNFLKTIIGANAAKVHARKCEVTDRPCIKFINNNHIQGYAGNTIRFFNLEYDGLIVASMTASRHHRQNNKNVIVLNRLCFRDGYNVQGGATKLFSRFVNWARHGGFDEIVSWSDNCWTDGNIYKVLGFSLRQEHGPDYFYWDCKKKKVVSKQSQQKKLTGCPEGMTEREWCLERGLFRIWDTGKRRWVFPLK